MTRHSNTNGNGLFWRNISITAAISIVTAIGSTVVVLMVNHARMMGVDEKQDVRIQFLEEKLREHTHL